MQITIGLIIGLVVGYVTSYFYLLRVTEANRKSVEDLKSQLTLTTGSKTPEERLSSFGVANTTDFVINLNGHDTEYLICDYLTRNDISPYTFLDTEKDILFKYPKMQFKILVDGISFKTVVNPDEYKDDVISSSVNPFSYNGYFFKRSKESYKRFSKMAPDGEYILELTGGPYRRLNRRGKVTDYSDSAWMSTCILIPLDKLFDK